jgi:hypothetical protein
VPLIAWIGVMGRTFLSRELCSSSSICEGRVVRAQMGHIPYTEVQEEEACRHPWSRREAEIEAEWASN